MKYQAIQDHGSLWLNVLALKVCLTSSFVYFQFQTEERITPDTESLPPFSPFYLQYPRVDANIPFPRTSGARFCSAGTGIY